MPGTLSDLQLGEAHPGDQVWPNVKRLKSLFESQRNFYGSEKAVDIRRRTLNGDEDLQIHLSAGNFHSLQRPSRDYVKHRREQLFRERVRGGYIVEQTNLYSPELYNEDDKAYGRIEKEISKLDVHKIPSKSVTGCPSHEGTQSSLFSITTDRTMRDKQDNADVAATVSKAANNAVVESLVDTKQATEMKSNEVNSDGWKIVENERNKLKFIPEKTHPTSNGLILASDSNEDVRRRYRYEMQFSMEEETETEAEWYPSASFLSNQGFVNDESSSNSPKLCSDKNAKIENKRYPNFEPETINNMTCSAYAPKVQSVPNDRTQDYENSTLSPSVSFQDNNFRSHFARKGTNRDLNENGRSSYEEDGKLNVSSPSSLRACVSTPELNKMETANRDSPYWCRRKELEESNWSINYWEENEKMFSKQTKIDERNQEDASALDISSESGFASIRFPNDIVEEAASSLQTDFWQESNLHSEVDSKDEEALFWMNNANKDETCLKQVWNPTENLHHGEESRSYCSVRSDGDLSDPRNRGTYKPNSWCSVAGNHADRILLDKSGLNKRGSMEDLENIGTNACHSFSQRSRFDYIPMTDSEKISLNTFQTRDEPCRSDHLTNDETLPKRLMTNFNFEGNDDTNADTANLDRKRNASDIRRASERVRETNGEMTTKGNSSLSHKSPLDTWENIPYIDESVGDDYTDAQQGTSDNLSEPNHGPNNRQVTMHPPVAPVDIRQRLVHVDSVHMVSVAVPDHLRNVLERTKLDRRSFRSKPQVEVSAVRYAQEDLSARKMKRVAIFKGKTKSGKSFAGRILMNKLCKDLNFDPLIVEKVDRIEAADIENRVVLIEDIGGTFADKIDVGVWKNKLKHLHRICRGGNSRLILTFSDAVFCVFEQIIREFPLLQDACVFDLSTTFQLQRDEKKIAINKYVCHSQKKGIDLQVSQQLYSKLMELPGIAFWEYLETFMSDKVTFEKGHRFLETPQPFFVDILRTISNTPKTLAQGKLLRALAVSGGCFCLHNGQNMEKKLPKRNRLLGLLKWGKKDPKKNRNPDRDFLNDSTSEELRQAAEALTEIGLLRLEDNCTYRFRDRLTYNTVLLVSSESLIKSGHFFTTCDFRFVSEYITPAHRRRPFAVTVGKDQYADFCNRLIEELKKGNVQNIGLHPIWSDLDFVNTFFIAVEELGRKKSLQVLSSEDSTSGGALIVHAIAYPEVVQRILQHPKWKKYSRIGATSKVQDKHHCVLHQNKQAMLKACEEGNAGTFKLISEVGTTVEEDHLVLASRSGNSRLLNLVLEMLDDKICRKDILSRAAIDTAVCFSEHEMSHYWDMVQEEDTQYIIPKNIVILREKGANLNFSVSGRESIFQVAMEDCKINLMKNLLNWGIRPDIFTPTRDLSLNEETMKRLYSALKRDPKLLCLDKPEGGIIHKAVMCHSNLVEDLLDIFPSLVDSVDNQGTTPLHLCSQIGSVEIAELLCTRGANVRLSNRFQETPLSTAVNYQHWPVVDTLVNAGAPLKEIVRNVVQSGDVGRAIYLIKNRTTANIKTTQGDPLMALAIKNGDLKMVEFLLQAGANVHTTDPDGLPPLHLAAKMGDCKLLQLLIEYEARIDVRDDEGNTVLHWSSARGDVKMVKYLLKIRTGSALLPLRNKKGWTAFHIASYCGRPCILGILLKSDSDVWVLTNRRENLFDLVKHGFRYSGLSRYLTPVLYIHFGCREDFYRTVLILKNCCQRKREIFV